MKRKLSQILVAVTVSVLAFGVSAFAADSNIGTWKLNAAASKFSPGPAPKSQTLKIVAWGADGVTFTANGVGADGKPTHYTFKAKYDGKFVAATGNPDFDMLAYKRIDANTIEATTQLKGTVMGNTRAVVSNGGKTRTLTQTGTNAKGEKVNNVIVYDKQ